MELHIYSWVQYGTCITSDKVPLPVRSSTGNVRVYVIFEKKLEILGVGNLHVASNVP